LSVCEAHFYRNRPLKSLGDFFCLSGLAILIFAVITLAILNRRRWDL